MESFEVYFSDLNEEAKENYLVFIGVDSESELNQEIAPIAIINIEMDKV